MEIYSVKLIYSSLSVNVKLLYPYNTQINISPGFYLSFLWFITFGFYFYHITLILLKFFKLKVAEEVGLGNQISSVSYQSNHGTLSTFVRIPEYYRTAYI